MTLAIPDKTIAESRRNSTPWFFGVSLDDIVHNITMTKCMVYSPLSTYNMRPAYTRFKICCSGFNF